MEIFVQKFKNEKRKTQINDKNVIYPSGTIQKDVIQLDHAEIQIFVLFGFSGPWSVNKQKFDTFLNNTKSRSNNTKTRSRE